MSRSTTAVNMQYRVLGKTGISVSEVSFGSHLKKSNVENFEYRRRQIEAGLEKGINLFDIYEPSYRQFTPMSRMLEHVRDKVVISLVTVWRAADEVADEVESSLRVFKRDYIDLYRVYFSGNWDDSEQRLKALLKAKQQGKIRAVGGVVHYPAHLFEALKRYPELGYLMAPACFCATRLLHDPEIVSAIRRHNIGIIAMKPMGAADSEGGYIFRLKPPKHRIEAFRESGLVLGRLAIKSVLQSDVVATVLPAMNTVEEVSENVQASGDGALTAAEQAFLQLYLDEADSSLASILPENDYWITPWKM